MIFLYKLFIYVIKIFWFFVNLDIVNIYKFESGKDWVGGN